ncbi:LysM peptidoglycan-binding domain-containing protein [Methylomagnum sp.]
MSSSRFPRSGHNHTFGLEPGRATILPILLGVCLWLSGAFALADEIELNPNHPNRYTVVPGDTLWDIAARFLNSPWQWPDIWQENRHIENPHLIYPGDVIVLGEYNGRPSLRVETPSELRLSPHAHSRPMDAAIPAIPMKVISPYLTRPQVVEADTLVDSPYVVALADEHIVGGAGNRVYVRAIESPDTEAYVMYRSGQPYRDAETGEVLGYEALYMGDSRLEQAGDPATLMLTRTEKEIRIGDRVMPFKPEPIRINYQPHAPKAKIRSHIIGVVGGVTQIGQYSVVVLDKGAADGLEIGHVLEIRQNGPMIRDIVSRRPGESVPMPEQKAGVLMVFRTFDRVSYGLVMRANRFVHVLDAAQTP